ncbi:hypothetical protein IFM89_001288 [Coptis chinensis]|uniref:DRBM domain-containing protein n=1 Tax=Coptis chinensis TaxID=261450 RepID=A0A835IXH9_9MAGN|nr:hypothetical protein IFM89_001288 [Coptis chinensis]
MLSAEHSSCQQSYKSARQLSSLTHEKRGVARYIKWVEKKGWWTDDDEAVLRSNVRKEAWHNGPSLDAKVNEFSLAIKKEEQACEISAYGGKVKTPKVLVDIVEPVAAAVYVDAKFDLKFMWEVFSPLLEPIVALENLQQPLTMLYELCQKQGKNVDIKHWRNGKNNITNILVDGKLLASVCSEQKETSKLSAAKAALEKMLISKSMLILADDSCELLNGVESYGILYKEDHIVMFPIKFVYYVDKSKDQVGRAELDRSRNY